MANKEIYIELLLGKRVLDKRGKPVGRIEELCAESLKGECVVQEFHIGSYAGLERLSAWSIGRAILRLFGATKANGGYRVTWDKLDLTDPEKPRLLCSVKELKRLKVES
jgi:sporulation protein YlmC with PRC-barrel domain